MSRRLLSKLTHADQAGLALLLLCGVLSTLSPVFLTVGNITNILRDASIVAIAGFGMVVIILQGEIDLRIGSAQAVVGILTVPGFDRRVPHDARVGQRF